MLTYVTKQWEDVEMKKLLTAEEARKLAGPSLEEKVESLIETIKTLAKQKKRSCRTGYDHKEDEDMWIYGGYDGTEEWQNAKKILKGLGYKVTFYYKVHSVAVDMYTLIEW